MRIEYKKRHLNIFLILGIVMLAIGLLNLNYDRENRWTDYGYIVFAILYLVLFIYQKQNKYLTIKNGILKILVVFATTGFFNESSMNKF